MSGEIELEDDLKRIATRIRGWRDEAGLTLQQLGDQSGVSASTIHKIENLQTVPTIAVLLKVANGLNRRPSELLADVEAGKQVAVLPAAERQHLEVPGRAKMEHLAAMIPRNRLDVWRVELEPGHGPGAHSEAWQFNGEIVLMIESGEIELEIDDEFYKAGPGDSVHFETTSPHRWRAIGNQPVVAIVFALLPERLQGDLLTRISMSSEVAQRVLASSRIPTPEGQSARVAEPGSARVVSIGSVEPEASRLS